MSHPDRLKFRILVAFFLVTVSLITSLVILSELVLSYPGILLPLFVSDPTPDCVEAALEDLEWHTRAQASALAFGAFVFVWYKLLIGFVHLMIKLRYFISGSRRCTTDTDTCSVGSPDCPFMAAEECQGNSRKRCTGWRPYMVFLLAVIIINDSIYNRCREMTTSGACSFVDFSSFTLPPIPIPSLSIVPSPSSYFSTVVTSLWWSIQTLLPGAFTRLFSMASRSLPICAGEVSVLFLALYAMGVWHRDRCSMMGLESLDEASSFSQEPSNLSEGSGGELKLGSDSEVVPKANVPELVPLGVEQEMKCRDSDLDCGFFARQWRSYRRAQEDGAVSSFIRGTEEVVGSHDDEKKDLVLD